MKALILTFFFLITLLDAYLYGGEFHHYRFFSGALIIPFLLLYYLITTKKRNPFILLAFLFVWLGDLMLLIESAPVYLKWAVFFYWIMQLCLLRVYLSYWKKYSINAHILGLLFWGSYLVVFLNHVFHTLGDMKIHGLVYGLTLSVFGSFALMELLKKASKQNFLMFIGILIFSVRDVFLTYNKKYFNEEVFTFSIPILHGIGFLIIIKALLTLDREPRTPIEGVRLKN